MKKKMFVAVVCMLFVGANSFANDATKIPQKTDADVEMMVLMDAPRPMFMMEGGVMMPPHGMHMEHDFGRPDFNHDIKLTDKQREKFKILGKKHKDDIHEMNTARIALHERYQEKIEAILTDEQFRKIENMRKDLRKDLRKLDEKQHRLFKEHRHDFESILTDEQKQQLKNTRNEYKKCDCAKMHNNVKEMPKHKDKK